VNPAALSVAQLARMLGVPEETVRRHVAAGAPATSDGRINLVHYAAWLNGRLGRDAEGAGDHGA
jgi:plasmid maintenance system antidote protein VapI